MTIGYESSPWLDPAFGGLLTPRPDYGDATEFERPFTVYMTKDDGTRIGREIEGIATIKPVDDEVIVTDIRMDGAAIDFEGSEDERRIWGMVGDYFDGFDVRELGE